MKAIVLEKTGGPEVLAPADVPKPDARESRASMGKPILTPPS